MPSSVEYRLNTRFLGWLLAITAVASLGIFFLHRYQEKQLISRYIHQADQAEASGERIKEINYLKQYLALQPADNDKLVRYGMVACKYGTTSGQITDGYYALQKALRHDDKLSPEVRMQCIKLAIRRVNEPLEAKRNLELLFPDRKMSEEGSIYYTEALIRLREFPEAEDFLTRVTSDHKTRIDAYMCLALLKRERNNIQGADLVLQSMLKDNEKDPKAWLRAANYHKRFQNPAKYGEAIARARELAPDNAEVLFGSAEHKLSLWQATWPLSGKPEPNADFDEAIRLLNQSLNALGPLPAIDPLPEEGTPERTKLELAVAIYRRLSSSLTTVERFSEAEKYARELVAKFPNPDLVVLQVELLNVLVRQKKYEEARAICAKMSQRGFATAFVELQLGFIDFQQQKYVDAARHLERVVTELANYPDEKRLACLRLAKCYEETGEIDRAIDALRNAVPSNTLDPFWSSCNVSLAEMLARVGRIQEAIALYKDVVKKEPRVLETMVNLMITQLEKHPESANEADLRSYLNKLPPGPSKDILTSKILEVKKDPSARQVLIKAVKDNPKDPMPLVSLVRMELRDRKFDAAKTLIDQGTSQFGDAFVIRHLKALLAIEKGAGDPGLAAELEALAIGAEKFAPAERLALYKQLSLGARAIERRDLARTWLKACISERGEQDIDIHYALLDLAVLDGDEAEIQRGLDGIARIAGGTDNHTYRLAQSFTLVHKAQKLKDQPAERRRILEHAQELLAGLENTRKEWSRLDFAQAMVADMLGQRDQAIAKYQRAIDHGERHPEIFRRYVDLLRLTRRDDLLARLVVNFPDVKNILNEDPRSQVEIHIRNNEFASAIDLARKSVTDSNEDPKKLFWLADVLFRCQKPIDSEAVLRKAQRLVPDDAEVWIAFLQVLLHNKKDSEAKSLAADTEAKLKSGDPPLAIARAAMLLGDRQKARALYLALLESRGHQLPVLRAAGDYFISMERDIGKTVALMKKILTHPEKTPVDIEVARRMLARCVIVSRDHKTGEEALEILGYKSPTEAATFKGDEALDDLRARFAILTVIRGLEAKEASVLTLRKIEERAKELPLEEQLAFGQILYSLGRREESLRRLQRAANAPGDSPVAIALYANALLRENLLEDAAKQIDRLQKKDPDGRATAELRARWCVLNKKNHEAAEILTRFGNSKPENLVIAAALLDQMGLPEDAAPLYRRAAADPNAWDKKLLYASFLARNNKAEESLELFREVWTQPLEMTVPLLCESMMHASDSAAGHVRLRAGEMIATAAAKDAKFLPFQAAYLSITDKVPEAISFFRDCLSKNPNDLFSLNNLAFLLAYQPNGNDEALKFIRKAMSLVGPMPNLLDTEAFILMKSDKASDINDAIEKLKIVVLDEPSATAYMHLAMAYLLLPGKTPEARHYYSKAKQHNLRLSDFHPLEREQVRRAIGTLEK